MMRLNEHVNFPLSLCDFAVFVFSQFRIYDQCFNVQIFICFHHIVSVDVREFLSI